MFSVCRLVSRRCHAISTIRRFVPGSSQNRTWSVTGSQFDSFPIGQAQRPIDSRRPLPRNAGRLRACTKGTRTPTACLNLLPRTESSRCRAVYHPHAVSNSHPQRCPRITGNRHYYRRLRLPHPAARVLAIFACSRVPASRRTETRTSSVTAHSHCQARHGLGPREHWHRSPSRGTECCLRAGQCRRRSPTKIFGAQHLQGRLHPLPLHLACFRAYASTRPLPCAPHGSILGSWLATTQVGFAPTRLRDIAKPQWPLFPFQ